MTVYMTQKRWDGTHQDYRGQINGSKTVVTETGIDYVEIVPATDARIDSTGYGRVI